MQPSSVWALKPLADMSAAEFHAWQTLLEERTGLVINEQRRAFLQTSLSARMRELDVADYASYYQQVTDGPRGAAERFARIQAQSQRRTHARFVPDFLRFRRFAAQHQHNFPTRRCGLEVR